jgi:hypothetical protein
MAKKSKYTGRRNKGPNAVKIGTTEDIIQQIHENQKAVDEVVDAPSIAAQMQNLSGAVEQVTMEDDIKKEAEAEPKESNSVVASKFKQRYLANAREQGVKGKAARRSNWDWLSQEIAKACLGPKDKIRMDDFLAILEANGIDHRKWPNRAQGWEGRLRMTGRVALQRIVADAGKLKLPGGAELEVPAEFKEKYRTKA